MASTASTPRAFRFVIARVFPWSLVAVGLILLALGIQESSAGAAGDRRSSPAEAVESSAVAESPADSARIAPQPSTQAESRVFAGASFLLVGAALVVLLPRLIPIPS